jgi:hypothetical protein
MVQAQSAQGASQVPPMMAQPLNAIPTGPKRAHMSSTIAVMTRRRAELMNSSFSELKGIILIKGYEMLRFLI